MSTYFESKALEPRSRSSRLQPRPLARALNRASQAARHIVTRGVFAIPILPGGRPDGGRASEGITVDIGADGMTFEVASVASQATSKWMVGVEQEDGELRYLAVKPHKVSRAGIGLRIDGTFLNAADDPLHADNLVPSFDPHTFQFRPRISTEAAQQWQALGVVHPELFDCILVCPRCRSLPTIRRGCRACGSVEVKQDQFVHHFACAHVALVDQFELEKEMVCPKCRVKRLVVGADFEFLCGPHTCLDCGWSDKDLEHIARCMSCGFEFPENQATEEEVFGYHVERLEPLDLVAAH